MDMSSWYEAVRKWKNGEANRTEEDISLSFTVGSSRRKDTYREGRNPFTGEINRFYDFACTAEELEAIAGLADQYGFDIDRDIIFSEAEIEGTRIQMPNTDLKSKSFIGSSVILIGTAISDESLGFVLTLCREGGLYLGPCVGTSLLAAPSEEIKSRLEKFHDDEVLLVENTQQILAWLKKVQ